jgi:cell division protein FtsI (penicillin-binding protein 3)
VKRTTQHYSVAPQPGAPSSGGASGFGSGGTRSLNYATSPLLASRTPPWRSRFVLLLVALAFLALVARAVEVQIIRPGFYQQKGEVRYVLKETLAASRGRIVDRNGALLAGSVQLPSALLDSKNFAADTEQRKALSRLLGFKPGELDERLLGARGTLMLRRHLEPALWAQVKDLKIKGLYDMPEFKRRYPEGEAAAHVVGFTDVEDKGQAGAELVFHQRLLGSAGARKVVRDRLGQVIENLDDPVQPRHGSDVALSIDARIQSFAWQRVRDAVKEHAAATGSVVVLDALTGEVLALANYPSYDPANSVDRDGRAKALRNVAVVDVFEPGSTVKPFTVAMALESGRWTPNTMVDAGAARYQTHGTTITDTKPHGWINVSQVLQKSSNIGTVKMAQQLPAQSLWTMFNAVGFGQKPELDFPALAKGKLRPHKGWRPVEHDTMSYGYGLNASLFQLAQAYTVFARNGDLVPVTLLKRDATAAPVVGTPVMSAKTATQVREMLRLAANPGGGTAPLAQERTLGYSVGGKTGTVRVSGKGGYTDKHHSFFVGLAPISNPRLVVAVLVSQPSRGKYYGGEVAAPVFGAVMEQSLRVMNVPTDMDVKAQISAKPAVAELESN